MKLVRFVFELVCGMLLFTGMFWTFYTFATIAYVH